VKLTKTLDELDSKRLVASYGVPVAVTTMLADPDEISAVARQIPFPWVMKILSEDILHKTDAGCVRLPVPDVGSARAAAGEILANARAYKPDARIRGVLVQEMVDADIELILGVNKDPQFGHTVVFGLGGIYVEMFKMVSLRLVPLTRYDAIQMIDELPIAKIFDGMRGRHFDKEQLVDALLALSRLAEEHPEISEIDVNPFLLREGGGKAVDAVVVV